MYLCTLIFRPAYKSKGKVCKNYEAKAKEIKPKTKKENAMQCNTNSLLKKSGKVKSC